MRHARAYGLVGLAALAAVAVAVAQTSVIPVPDKAPVEVAPLASAPEVATWGDPKKGQAKAGTCAACHGLDGNPPSPVAYPRLAGMPERYIAQQLALFKGQQRTTGMAAVMYPFAEPLSAQDMRDLGAWFQTQKAAAGIADDTAIASGPNAGRRYFEVGETLFRGGDKTRGIPACMACHGSAGQGNPGPAYPALGGQLADYSKRRLEEYRTGTGAPPTYKNFHIMASIASKLTDEEIGSLSSYLQGLHLRSNDAGAEASAAASPTAATASTPAPATQAMPAATSAQPASVPAQNTAPVQPAATPAAPAAPAGSTPAQG